MAGKFEVYKDKRGEFRFRLKSSNGQTILVSEGYKAQDSCMKGIASVQKNGANPARFERKVAKNGKHHFTLKAANHQVIGSSELYDSETNMEAGIASVQRNAATTTIDTQT
jgi:uncharacterized protein YegP (UPF0339 family)